VPLAGVGGRAFGKMHNHNNFSALIFVQLAQTFSQNRAVRHFAQIYPHFYRSFVQNDEI
jgi:hypothetical protein